MLYSLNIELGEGVLNMVDNFAKNHQDLTKKIVSHEVAQMNNKLGKNKINYKDSERLVSLFNGRFSSC